MTTSIFIPVITSVMIFLRTPEFSAFDFQMHLPSCPGHVLFISKPSKTALIDYGLKNPSHAFHCFSAPGCSSSALKKSWQLTSKGQTDRHNILLEILTPAGTLSNLGGMIV
jgi:hypothetical protein